MSRFDYWQRWTILGTACFVAIIFAFALAMVIVPDSPADSCANHGGVTQIKQDSTDTYFVCKDGYIAERT